jgi:hypothetical protein
MTSIFGPNGQRVLALVSAIPALSADQVDQVTSSWKHASARDRAQAWAQLSRASGEDERYRILAAASLARREALATAQRVRRTDWAFWAAACDASAAVAAGALIGRHYDTLVAPFATVMPALALRPVPSLSSPTASGEHHQAERDVPRQERLADRTHAH